VHEYRLRIHPQRPDHAWQAELQDAAAPPGTAPLTFDTPLELARHLSRDPARGPAGPAPAAGLR
jgi:hypothetical protein